MVKFISKLGGLFGGNQKKKDTPKKAGPKPSKPKAKPSKPRKKPAKPKSTPAKPRQAKPKPGATTQAKNSHSTQAKPKPGAGTHAVQKPAAMLQKKPAAVVAKPQIKPVALAKPEEHLRSVVLFTTPTCPDCASARKLVGDVRRVARNTVFREVDLSTREGELEGLLHGVVQSPSFVINGRLVFRGVLPAREQLARVINEGAPQ